MRHSSPGVTASTDTTPLPRYPPSDACHKLKDGLTALNYLEVSDREEMSDVEEVREILSCPGVRALLQSHDVVAHEVYGEEAVRVTPPNSTVNLTVAQDDVEGPNGECPPVSEAMAGPVRERELKSRKFSSQQPSSTGNFSSYFSWGSWLTTLFIFHQETADRAGV